jgi:O-antigen ligase
MTDTNQTIFIKRHLKKASPRRPAQSPEARLQRKQRINTYIALGLWGLLWCGYNTSNAFVRSPGFPRNTTELIHGVRAFFPIVAGWIALMIIFSRAQRVVRWIMGPLGLFLLYCLVGLASSLLLSIDPIDALYWGANYLAIILVLLAIISVDNALPDISKLLTFNWFVSTGLTFMLLGLLPFMGGPIDADADVYSASAVRHSYNGGGEILGMAGARNTGFGRYAAIAALAGLARMRRGKRWERVAWGAEFLIATYALILSNGRTEVFAFIVSAALILYADKSKRVIYFLGAIGMSILLGLHGFFRAFYAYFTRTGHFDFTFTGRTDTWHLGILLFSDSPWVGLGFQADRIYLPFQQHMHNAFLSALVQSGVIGGAALFIGLIVIGVLAAKYFFLRPLRNKEFIPPEIPGIFVFLIVSSIAESTFAYFSAAWLLTAPIVIYVLALDRQVRQSSAVLAKQRGENLPFRSSRREELTPAADGMLPLRRLPYRR